MFVAGGDEHPGARGPEAETSGRLRFCRGLSSGPGGRRAPSHSPTGGGVRCSTTRRLEVGGSFASVIDPQAGATETSDVPRHVLKLWPSGPRGVRVHAPRQRATGPRLDDDQGPKSSQLPPASRGTSHARPTYTTHMGRRFAAEDVRLGAGDSVRKGGFVRGRGEIKWSELGHRIVAASAGSSVVTGFIDAVIPQGTVLAHAAWVPAEERLIAHVDPVPAQKILSGPNRAFLGCRSHRTVDSVPSHTTDRPGGLALDRATFPDPINEVEVRAGTLCGSEAGPWDPRPDVRVRAGLRDPVVVIHTQAGVGL
ncbi:unnamed protein product [Lampetra planeri]